MTILFALCAGLVAFAQIESRLEVDFSAQEAVSTAASPEFSLTLYALPAKWRIGQIDFATRVHKLEALDLRTRQKRFVWQWPENIGRFAIAFREPSKIGVVCLGMDEADFFEIDLRAEELELRPFNPVARFPRRPSSDTPSYFSTLRLLKEKMKAGPGTFQPWDTVPVKIQSFSWKDGGWELVAELRCGTFTYVRGEREQKWSIRDE